MKKIQKWNKPALRVFDANEHLSNPEDPGGTWQAFDAKIEQAEKAELKRQGVQEQYLEKVFLEKRQQELSHKKMKDLSWEECHILDDMRNQQSKYFSKDVANIAKAVSDTDSSDDGDYMSCLQTIKQCLEILSEVAPNFPNDVPKLVSLFQQLAKKIEQEMEKEEKQPDRESEEIRDQTPVEVQNSFQIHKGLEITKSNDQTRISGFASVEIVDRHNDLVPLSTLRKALPQYLGNGAIVMLNHSNRPIGKIVSHDFRRSFSGDEGLYIEVELFKHHNEDVLKMINDGTLKGFSIGGAAFSDDSYAHKCDTVKCWREIKELKLYEISLTHEPANQQSFIQTVN